MIIRHILQNDWTRELHTVHEDDATSPSTGYTQGHADRAGAEYAKNRAPAKLGDTDYTCLSSSYMRQ